VDVLNSFENSKLSEEALDPVPMLLAKPSPYKYFSSILLVTEEAYHLLHHSIGTRSKDSLDHVWCRFLFPKTEVSSLFTLFQIKSLREHDMLRLQKNVLCLKTNNRGERFRIKGEGDVRNAALY
jgi:hypothetical protein